MGLVFRGYSWQDGGKFPARFTAKNRYRVIGGLNGEIFSELGSRPGELCHFVARQAADAVSGAVGNQLLDRDAAAWRQRTGDFLACTARIRNYSTQFSTFHQVTGVHGDTVRFLSGELFCDRIF